MRFKKIDFLKGLLIILVISGHILQGKILDSFSRYIIYSFHMPLFIGISGFLFNYSKVGALTLLDFIRKYFFRVVIPWSIAVIAYKLIDYKGVLALSNSYKVVFNSFLFPFYHLWFVPGFLSWVGLSWLFSKYKISLQTVLVFSLTISFISYTLNLYPVLYEKFKMSFYIKTLIGTFRPYFYVFFVLGTYLRTNKKANNHTLLERVALFAGIISTVILFFYPNRIATLFAFFVLNMALLSVVLKKVNETPFIQSSAIEWMGGNSLGIYLWHVTGIILVSKVIGTNNLFLFYSITVGVEIAIIFLIYYLSKNKLINKYLFGIA